MKERSVNRIDAKYLPGFLWLFCCMTVLLSGAHAADSLKTINNPGGGQILYGPFGGESTLKGAMGAMLRDVHTRLSDPAADRPAVPDAPTGFHRNVLHPYR
jgi:hypothetical protein